MVAPENHRPSYFWERAWAALKRTPELTRHFLAALAGVILGPLIVQSMYRLEFLPLDGFTFLAPMLVVAAGAAYLWRRGHRWFAGGLAAGTALWTVALIWVIYEFSRGAFAD